MDKSFIDCVVSNDLVTIKEKIETIAAQKIMEQVSEKKVIILDKINKG